MGVLINKKSDELDSKTQPHRLKKTMHVDINVQKSSHAERPLKRDKYYKSNHYKETGVV